MKITTLSGMPKTVYLYKRYSHAFMILVRVRFGLEVGFIFFKAIRFSWYLNASLLWRLASNKVFLSELDNLTVVVAVNKIVIKLMVFTLKVVLKNLWNLF